MNETNATETSGYIQCGARTRKGVPCKRPPAVGRTRCNLHGGASPKGLSSPNFKHGRYSTDVPTRLAAKYQQAEADPQLLSNRSDIALLTARIGELIRRLHTGESGSLWQRLLKSWDDVNKSTTPEELRTAMAAHGYILSQGANDEGVWQELVNTINDKSVLASREHSQLVDMHQMLSAEQALLLQGLILQAVEDCVADPTVRSAIGARLQQLYHRRPLNQADVVIEHDPKTIIDQDVRQ